LDGVAGRVEDVGVVVVEEEVGKGAGWWGGHTLMVQEEEGGALHVTDARRQEACWASSLSCNRC
jgi:hypothetical protein